MLSARCGMCNSWKWCGRQCKNAPAKPVINIAVTEPDATPALLTSATSRQAKWRQANAEINRIRARDGMRKRRANEKANG